MKADADGVHRTEWRAQPILDHAPVVATRAAATITTHDRIERASRAPPVASVERRINEWVDRLQDQVDDAVEDGEGLSDVELVAEAAGLLQNATDTALATLDRQIAKAGEAHAEAQGEIDALRRRVNDLETARRADADRHQRELVTLTKRLEAFEKTSSVEIEKVRAALRIEAAEAAEGRSIERLRSSSWSKLHRAKVEQRLALAKEAMQ